MTTSTEKPIENVIESAMACLKAESANGDSESRQGIGRRDYDQGPANRLQQIQATSEELAPPATVANGQHLTQDPAGRSFQPATLTATALISALAGAALMWLAIGGKAATPVFPPPENLALKIPQLAAATVQPPPQAVSAPEAPPPPSPPEPAPEITLEDELGTLLAAWREAWSNRDADAYLGYYSPDFAPADGQSRDTWAAARRKNLASRPSIEVSINTLNIEPLAENQAKASFLQDYASGSYRETAQPKTLLLSRKDGIWLIAGEWQGKQVPKIAAK